MFSETMVPFGDPRSPIDPFIIDCPEDGVGRWIDSRAWVYNFAHDLPGGVRCGFKLRPGLVTQAGTLVTGQTIFTFTTGGPSILTSIPFQVSTIDEDQAFVLGLDTQPTEESVLQHAAFAVAGLPERIGVRLITGEGREAILKTLYGWVERKHVLILQAKQTFPSGANVRLLWGKGVTAESGVANEQDQVLSFKVRPPFLAEFHCERQSRRFACLPITPMSLRFSASVAWEQAQRIMLVAAQGGRRSPMLDRSDEGMPFVSRINFRGPFPEAATFRIEIPDGLTDETGRPLANANRFPLQVKTAEFPPLAKFAARFGIVEWKADPTLPVTLRNLEPEIRTRLLQVAEAVGDKTARSKTDTPDQILGRHLHLSPDQPQDVLAWLRAVATAARDSSIFGTQPAPPSVKSFVLPKPHEAKPLEVVGIPLEVPGLYIVEIESPRLGASLLGKPQAMFVPTSVLVTNLSVHFKWGREASLIWVTTLDEGRPVHEAQVAVHDCKGQTLWAGATDNQGIARVGKLPSQEALAECPYEGNLPHYDSQQTLAINRFDSGLFVTAALANDFSFAHSSWDRGIEPWRFQLPLTNDREAIITHTVLDRSLLRAGDTVHMKHILREQTLHGFSRVPDDQLPNRVSIRHVGNEEKYALPLDWEAGGIAESSWAIPKGAKLGRYVDEGLLELLPNESWNLLEAMMGRRRYGVRIATAQMEVVGKRHYGLKALPQGGGGGKQPTRELFNTLLFWNGRVPLDANGEASLEIPLNDSLTSFRLVAVATGGLELFGTGSTSIRSTQDLMILSGITPLVREGDQFRAEFTLRNTTNQATEVQVQGRVDGLPDPLTARALSLASSQSQVIGWDIIVPTGVRALRYEVEAMASGGAADRIRVVQQVYPVVPIRTFQATISQWQREIKQPLQRPADALPDRGGVQLLVRPSLVEGMGAMRDWMRRYPYSCLEQLISQAVALRDQGRWQQIAAILPSHLDSDGLLKYFPALEQGSEVLTPYALSIVHEAGWEIPAEVRECMIQGLQRFVEGAIQRRPPFAAADLSLRKLAAVEALSRYITVKPQVLGSIIIEPNLWPTSTVLDWWSVLHRVTGIRNQDSQLRQAEQIVRSRLNLQGRALGFSSANPDGLWWLMTSADTNAVRLMLLLLEQRLWQEDLPRLLNGTLARQQHGTWDLTVANAWGALAIEKFSQMFEKTPIGGTTTASLGSAVREVTWAHTPQGDALAFPWPGTDTTLTVDHVGAGHPWVTLAAMAAIPLKASLVSGYRLTKSLIPVDASTAGRGVISSQEL